jgi:putative redox protein
MTLRMYADRKEWPLEEAVVRLEHGKVHAEDDDRACRTDGDDGPAKIDRIVREIVLTGDLSEEQRERLVEIAGRCPVHRTLEQGVLTETREAEG